MFNQLQDNKIFEAHDTYKIVELIEEIKVNCNELSFGIEMKKTDIIDNDGSYITEKFVDREYDDEKQKEELCINGLFKSDETFIWRIGINEGLDNMKYADIGEYFESKYFDVFGLRLKIRSYSNGRTRIHHNNTSSNNTRSNNTRSYQYNGIELIYDPDDAELVFVNDLDDCKTEC